MENVPLPIIDRQTNRPTDRDGPTNRLMDTQRDGRRDGRRDGPRVRWVEPFRGRQRQMKGSVSEDGWKNTQTYRKTDRQTDTD